MIPNVPRETLLEAMEEFDKNLRDTQEWSYWEHKGTHKFAIAHNDRLRQFCTLGLICS